MTINEKRFKIETDLKRARDRQKRLEKQLKQFDRNAR